MKNRHSDFAQHTWIGQLLGWAHGCWGATVTLLGMVASWGSLECMRYHRDFLVSFPEAMPLSSALGWALGADEAEKAVLAHHSKPTTQRREVCWEMISLDELLGICQSSHVQTKENENNSS